MSTSDAESWRPNVAAIILDDADNVLLGTTRSASRHLHVPQGGVNRGESMIHAVLREVREEVGLQREQLRVQARFGGLRYRYRHKNRKSSIWDGQEQTFFLLRCRGVAPPLELSGSPEFAAAQWVPWYTLEPGMFVSFKQPVMRQVLEHFFPKHLTPKALPGHLEHNCRIQRYLNPAGTPPPACISDDRYLFAGGKEEAEYQFTDAAQELLDLQRHAEAQGRALLLIPLSLPGSGLHPCLRRLARCMDPLRTHIVTTAPQAGDPSPVSRLLAAEPRPGQAVIALNSPYDTLLREIADPAAAPPPGLAALLDAEQQMQRKGIRILRLFLNTSEEIALKRCRKKNLPLSLPELIHLRAAAEQLMTPADWYLLPSDRGWYRNLMAIRAVAEALGSC